MMCMSVSVCSADMKITEKLLMSYLQIAQAGDDAAQIMCVAKTYSSSLHALLHGIIITMIIALLLFLFLQRNEEAGQDAVRGA